MAEGFLGRWSQRKQAVREGQPLAEPLNQPALPAAPAPAVLEAPPPPAAADKPPLPTLQDVQQLTSDSSFAPFVARDVAPEVRNAAMKKLFTDPHYNVMDGLDIYIDDYSKPDPLPASMLRQMASAKFLNLFEEEEKEPPPPTLRDDANSPGADSVAQSAPLPTTGVNPLTDNPPQPLGPDHDHPDLRLQPNDAAGPQEPGRGA